MKVAHPIEYQSWDPDLINYDENQGRSSQALLTPGLDLGRRRKDDYPEELEPPPALEAVMPGEVEVKPSSLD